MSDEYSKYVKLSNTTLKGITNILAQKLSDLNPDAHFVAVDADEIHSNISHKELEHINVPEKSYIRVDKKPAYGLAWISVGALKFKIETFL